MPLAAIVTLAAALTAAVPAPALQDTWSEVTTPHFVVMTDADPSVASDIATKLEHLTEVLDATHSGLRANLGQKTRVFAFRSLAAFKPYRRPKYENLAGYYLRARNQEFVAFTIEAPNTSLDETLYHEFTHLWLRNNLREIPVWVNEGLAVYYSTFRAGETTAEIGRAHLGYSAWVRDHRVLGIDDLFGLERDTTVFTRDDDRRSSFYADSWLLLHHLLQSTDANRSGFERFLEGLRRGDDPRRAFAASFPETSWPAIADAARATNERGQLQFVRYTFSKPFQIPDAARVKLDRSTALTRLGELLLIGREDDPSLAAEHFRAALDADPRNPLALAHLGSIEDDAHRPRAADSLYARALVIAPDDASVEATIGWGMMGPIRDSIASDTTRSVRFRAAQTHFANALTIAPEQFDALEGFGVSALLLDQKGAAGLSALGQAYATHPERDDLESNLCALAARDTASVAGRRFVDRHLASLLEPGAIARAGDRKLELAVAFAGDLVSGNRAADAESLLRRLVAEGTGPIRARARELAARIETQQASNSMVERYNQGILAMNRRRLAEATRIFTAVQSETSDPELKREAAARIAEVALVKRMDDALALARAGKLSQSRAAFEAILKEKEAMRPEQEAYVRKMLAQLQSASR